MIDLRHRFSGKSLRTSLQRKAGSGGGLVDRVADSGPCDPSSIPIGEKKENKQKEARVGPLKKI